MSRARAPRRPPRGPLSIPETATPGRGAGPQASRAPLSRGGRPRGPSSSPRPPGAPLSRSPSLNGPTVKSGPALCPCYAPRSMGALTLMGATRDGCFLGETNVCEPRICAARPKDAPTTGQPGRAPQTACRGLPAAAGAARGARRPRVSGAADRPGCAFAPVPAGSTSSPPRPWASISDLMGSQHPPARSYSSVVFICFFPSPPHPPSCFEGGSASSVPPRPPPDPRPLTEEGLLQVLRDRRSLEGAWTPGGGGPPGSPHLASRRCSPEARRDRRGPPATSSCFTRRTDSTDRSSVSVCCYKTVLSPPWVGSLSAALRKHLASGGGRGRFPGAPPSGRWTPTPGPTAEPWGRAHCARGVAGAPGRAGGRPAHGPSDIGSPPAPPPPTRPRSRDGVQTWCAGAFFALPQ